MRIRRRAAALLLVALVPLGVAGPAAADKISDKRREAARVADQIEALDAKAEQLTEDVNNATWKIDELSQQIAEAEDELSRTEASMDVLRTRMGEWAVRAYVQSAAAGGDLISMLTVGGDQGDGALRAGFIDVAVGSDQQLNDEMRTRGLDVEEQRTNLDGKKAQQAALKKNLQRQIAAAEGASEKAAATLSRLQGEIRTLVIEEQKRREEEARKRAQAEAAARERKRQAALAKAKSSGSGKSTGASGAKGSSKSRDRVTAVASTPRRAIPPPSPGSSGAVEAAMSQVGVPYRRFALDPGNGFDCSGLTSWAWSRAGRSLPHSSAAQFAMLPRVSADEAQPGDLVFFGSPVHHVGLYIGGGMMVHAPQTGDHVKVSPAFRRDMVGIGRP